MKALTIGREHYVTHTGFHLYIMRDEKYLAELHIDEIEQILKMMREQQAIMAAAKIEAAA